MLLAGVTFAVGMLAGLLASTTRNAWRLIVVLAFVGPVTTAGQFSPFLAAICGICVVRIVRLGRPPARRFVLIALAMLLALDVVALMHSPSVLFAVRPLALGGTLVLVAALVCSDEDAFAHWVDDLGRLMKALLAVEALSIALFRLVPSVELAYLRSPAARFVIGERAATLFTTQPDNVLQDDKAGGLMFTNGNSASMVMAFFALLLFARYLRRAHRGTLGVAVLCAAAALLTGSKTAAILGALILPAVLLVAAACWARRTTAPLGLCLVALPLGVWAGAAALAELNTFTQDADAAAGVRDTVWSTAWSYLADSPLLGVGFGGWQVLNTRNDYGIDPSLPPHNFLLYAWLQTGVLAPLIILALVLTFFWWSFALAVRTLDFRSLLARLCETAGVVWVLAHGMYDVTDFFGTTNTLPMVVLVLGTTARAYARRRADQKSPATHDPSPKERAQHDADDPGPRVLPGTAAARRRGVGVGV